MKNVTLPGARSPLVGAGGITERAFYQWMLAADSFITASSAAGADASASIKAIALKLGSPDGTISGIPSQGAKGVINGNGSIGVDGTLEEGVVNISLLYDTQFPAATSFYGADSTGQRGWVTVASALADSLTIDVATDPGTGISSFNLVSFGTLNTDNLTEGSTHLYFTKPRVANSLAQGSGITLAVDANGVTTISTTGAAGSPDLATIWASL